MATVAKVAVCMIVAVAFLVYGYISGYTDGQEAGRREL